MIPLVKMQKVTLFKTREISSGDISVNDGIPQYIIAGKVEGNFFLQVLTSKLQFLCK